MYKIEKLNSCSASELEAIAKKLQIKDYASLDKEALIYKILEEQALAATSKVEENTENARKNEKGKSKGRQKPLAQSKEKSEESTEQSLRKSNQQKRGRGQDKTSVKQEGNSKVPLSSLQDFAGAIEGEGVLDVMSEGYGFLRSADYNYLTSPDDVYVPHGMIRNHGLKKGDTVLGKLRPPKENEKYFGLVEILRVNGRSLEELYARRDFQNLVPLFPKTKLQLSYKPDQYALRIIELFAPIGKGQRAMIVSPPKAGKTMLLKEIADGISYNHPEVYLMVLMIGERPEEVTDMQRSVRAEVVASTFDEQHENHVRVATMTIEKARRMVECGHDVVIMLDSITRLARAHNIAVPTSGKILSGGVDAHALYAPKRFFGSARNVEGEGSLTIIATALVDTGSKMDEVIFEEFKGTSTSDIQLSRILANKGFFPAIDILRSGTRRGEDMQSPEHLKFINMIRRIIGDMNGSLEDPIKFILDNMKGTANNKEFLASVQY